MTVRVAINGFGRIGRNIVRAIYESGRKDIDVVAVNDLGPVETNAHLLRFDSVHGKFPREVEVVLYGHPDVLEVAVVGVPHPTLGEEVAALVVARPGTTPDPDALRSYARERVAAYKYPREVRVVDALPKGPTGKILKREIDVRAALGIGG